jgi:hypothetical protein
MIDLPSPEMARLDGLQGSWSFQEITRGVVTGRGQCTILRGPAGLSLVTDEILVAPEWAVSCHGILSWHPKTGRYRWFLADNLAPGVRALTGRWDGEWLFFEGDPEPVRGRPYELRLRVVEPSGLLVELEAWAAEPGPPIRRTRRYVQRERTAASRSSPGSAA